LYDIIDIFLGALGTSFPIALQIMKADNNAMCLGWQQLRRTSTSILPTNWRRRQQIRRWYCGGGGGVKIRL
jgi:hypothetical protein